MAVCISVQYASHPKENCLYEWPMSDCQMYHITSIYSSTHNLSTMKSDRKYNTTNSSLELVQGSPDSLRSALISCVREVSLWQGGVLRGLKLRPILHCEDVILRLLLLLVLLLLRLLLALPLSEEQVPGWRDGKWGCLDTL